MFYVDVFFPGERKFYQRFALLQSRSYVLWLNNLRVAETSWPANNESQNI